ncbi:carbohydrate ABC transporter permease [Mycoplasmoides fastidiosum]|uniref:carbohydrate ABC transporter permease n=1 Tax=Mycoplasmoides fastidiosum TaxID=92758 RepID=UPI00211567D0|nr:carbohydrate ABC transporter permease [Mycoplasmoides fastidiosum]UUD37767.1 carbohydrate ABC transporter permease [Mycoplasmoides fastidiosum]
MLGFIFKVFVLVFFSLVILFPFYFMINTALLTNEQSINGTFYAVPPQANWDSFVSAFNGGYWQALAYTILITAVSVGARVFFSMTAGYAFSLKRWRFKNATWLFMLLTLMLPEVALLLGQYKIIIDLKWNRNGFLIISMFLPFVASTFSAFMFRNAFAAIPDRTKEAAMIDGVGSLKFFWKVAIPMAKATVLTVVILTAFASWNSFTWPQLLLNSNQSGSQRFDVLSTWLFLTGRDNSGIDDNPIIYNNIRMAGAILVIIPMFIAYILFRKVMMRAISRQGSAIKG